MLQILLVRGNGAGVHIRFINDYVSWLIKAIRVKPKGQHDIEIASPYMSFAEALRSDFQTSKEENYNSIQERVGIARADPTDEIKEITAFEQYQYDIQWVSIKIKPLPGFFHEIHKALPSLMDYELEIGLQSDEIPLTNRVRGPYCKLLTEFFPVDLWPKRKKTRIRNLQYGPRKRG